MASGLFLYYILEHPRRLPPGPRYKNSAAWQHVHAEMSILVLRPQGASKSHLRFDRYERLKYSASAVVSLLEFLNQELI